ncbi:VirB4 component of type IV secretory pathway [Bacteroidales bacterium Barb4]|nr:VirB4 component of type IV secretory pathway [Bacteroidales bacterium Barb4]
MNALFGRHCAVVGTTGGGKSWTVSKLIESITANTDNKVILIDATGEYHTLKSKSFILGTDSYFPYQKLSISDLFFLLRPTGQSQRPILLEAIRSLKMVKISGKSGVKIKSGQEKEKFHNYYQEHIAEIENNDCDFDITFLTQQIKAECVYQNGGTFTSPNVSIWGGEDAKTYDYQTSLISRITDLINTEIFNQLMGFKNSPTIHTSLIDGIDDFLRSEQEEDSILRISFENIPSSFSAKEIVSNALASYLLHKARKKFFEKSPIILIIDEAHQFLNKSVKDEFFEIQSLDAFDLIAKECRKYGLFLCLATQMPRDIPIGTLSQMGTFIVHRLINEQDKKSNGECGFFS